MLQKISYAIIKRFELFGLVNDENREIYLFGSYQLLMLLINLISMISIGILFHQTAQCLLYMALFIPLRTYAGGYHACSSRKCYVYSTLCIIAAMLIIKLDFLNFTTCYGVATICGVIIFRLAPVEDRNKPLDDVEIIHYRVRSQVVLIIEGMFFIVSLTLKWKTGVTSASSSTNKNIEKILSNIKKSSNISRCGDEKIDTCVATAKVMLESGFDPKFVAGMLGNICYEGNIGLIEYYNSSQDYMQYMQNHYSYKSNYSGKYIYNVNLNNVYNMLKQLHESSGGTWRINGSRVGFGLGSIQWTFGRTYELVKIYREVNGQKSTITKADATKAEGLMISRELNSSDYNYIYNSWKNSQSSAYNAAYKICISYEVPADKDNQGIQRGNLAEKIYSDMMK